MIIEDDENKGSQLNRFILECLPHAGVLLRKSLTSGIRAIKAESWDLIILDMSIPTYDPGPDEPGGQSHHFGGREVLNQMDRFDIAAPVIVVTQYETFGYPSAVTLEQLDAEMRTQYAATYRGAVYYNAAIHGWKKQLAELIEATTKKHHER